MALASLIIATPIRPRSGGKTAFFARAQLLCGELPDGFDWSGLLATTTALMRELDTRQLIVFDHDTRIVVKGHK